MKKKEIIKIVSCHLNEREREGTVEIGNSRDHIKRLTKKKKKTNKKKVEMLPTASKGRPSSSTSRTNPMFVQYLRRIIKVLPLDLVSISNLIINIPTNFVRNLLFLD